MANSLGNRLRQLRLARGLKQSELADAIGLHQPQISAYEIGKFIPKGRSRRLLAEFFGLSVRDLMQRTRIRVGRTKPKAGRRTPVRGPSTKRSRTQCQRGQKAAKATSLGAVRTYAVQHGLTVQKIKLNGTTDALIVTA